MKLKRVSFEVAKALEKAGYPQIEIGYTKEGYKVSTQAKGIETTEYSAPTYLEVWLWLWREKKYRILLSASNQKWNEVHGIVDGVNGIVETYWHRGLPSYDATNHDANHIDPEEALIAAIEYLVDNDLIN